MAEALPARPQTPLPVAISDCLLGRSVRYDGSSARSSFPHTLLEGLFEFRGICPEVGIGMGTPRDPIQLVGTPFEPRVVGVNDPALDVTAALAEFGRATAATLTNVAGYVFMKNSPSCGLFQVKVYPTGGSSVTGAPIARGRGAHAAAVIGSLPALPAEENGRLHDPVVRENFITRVFAYAHWQACFVKPGPANAEQLAAFHRGYQYLLLAHSEAHYQRACSLLESPREPFHQDADKVTAYVRVLMEGLARPATVKGHARALSLVRGHVDRHLDSSRRGELDSLISALCRGEQSLATVLEVIKRHLCQRPDDYLACETYLDPHPGYVGTRRLL